MDNELLVKTIRSLCKKNNISISQLESDLNFGAGLISRWTRSSPSLDRIIDIADYFHVTLDEVVGRKYFTKDEFLISLIAMTESGNTIWKSYTKKECKAKHYSQDIDDGLDEKTYFTDYSDGYISIYTLYENNNIINPTEIKLFLQPDDESDLILQKYKTEELLSLWLSILGSVEKSNKEVKAANMKKLISDRNFLFVLPLENRTTRYEHSLGAMNIAQSFGKQLQNESNYLDLFSSSNNDNERFFEAFKLLLEWKRNVEKKYNSKNE